MNQPILELPAFHRLADGDSGRTTRLVEAFKALMSPEDAGNARKAP